MQVALYDTPGVVATTYLHGDKHASRVRSAWATADKCDVLLLLVDAHRQVTHRPSVHAAAVAAMVCKLAMRNTRL